MANLAGLRSDDWNNDRKNEVELLYIWHTQSSHLKANYIIVGSIYYTLRVSLVSLWIMATTIGYK